MPIPAVFRSDALPGYVVASLDVLRRSIYTRMPHWWLVIASPGDGTLSPWASTMGSFVPCLAISFQKIPRWCEFCFLLQLETASCRFSKLSIKQLTFPNITFLVVKCGATFDATWHQGKHYLLLQSLPAVPFVNWKGWLSASGQSMASMGISNTSVSLWGLEQSPSNADLGPQRK